MLYETCLSCNCSLVITEQNVSVCLVNISACAFEGIDGS